MKVKDKKLTHKLLMKAQEDANMLANKYAENVHVAFFMLCKLVDHEGKQYHLKYNVHTLTWELWEGYAEC